MKINEKSDLKTKILFGLDKVYDQLIEYKKYKKTDLIVSRNGKIIRIDPFTLAEKPL